MPLLSTQEHFGSDRKKRVFLLTDGDVDDPNAVIRQALMHNDTARVFSFGLGDGCDKHLVKEVAKAGRGTSTIVKDNDPNLNGLIIRALATAMEPSMKNAQYGFNDSLYAPEDEIYRNTLVYATQLMGSI